MAKARRRFSEEQREAGKWLYLACQSYGLDVEFMSAAKAHTVLDCLKRGDSVEKVAADNGLTGWKFVPPSDAQLSFMVKLRLPHRRAKCKRQAGLILDAHLKPLKLFNRLVRQIDKCASAADLDAVGRDVKLIAGVLPDDHFEPLCEAGKLRRRAIGGSRILE
jgi:hypothetical protein